MADSAIFAEMPYRMLPIGGTSERSLRVYVIPLGAYSTLTSVTYTLRDELGTLLQTSTWTGSATTASVNFTTPAGVVVGKRYRETWTPNAGGLPPFSQDVYAVTSLLSPPFTAEEPALMYPDILATPAGGYSTWVYALAQINDDVVSRLLAHGGAARADVWNLYALRPYYWHSAVAGYLRRASGGAPAILELAREHETMAEVEWARLRLDLDTDGDGDPDTSGTSPNQAQQARR